jgi:hypothetical protein
LLAQPALLLRQLGHLLHGFRQAGAGFRPRHLPARAHQLVGGRVERVHRAPGLVGGLARVRGGGGDRLAGTLHLLLRAAQCLADLGRDQRVLAGGLPHLLEQALQSFLDGALLGAQAGRRVGARAERVLHLELSLRQPPRFRERLVDRRGDFLAPALLHALPLLLELVAQRLELPGGALALLPRLGAPAPLGRAGRLAHLPARVTRLRCRALEALLAGAVAHGACQSLQRAAQRIGPLGQRPLPGGRGAAVARRHLLVPLPLLLRQVARFQAQVGEVALECGPPEQLAAPLQRFAKLPLGLRQALERVLGHFGVEVLERLLQRRQPLPQLGSQGAVELLPDFLQLPLPGGVGHPGGVGALPERLERLLELLGLPEQLLLAPGDRLGALGLLEGERLT